MIVGFMSNFRKPTDLARVIAVFCKHYGVDLIYLRPRDVNIKKNKVMGQMLISGNWEKVEVPLPKFIDIAPYCFKGENKELTDYLKENTFLSDDRTNRLSKEALQEKLKDNHKFSNLVIPTYQINEFKEVVNLIQKYPSVVLKPMNGIMGKGVYVIKKDEKTYTLGYKTENQLLSYRELEKFFNENIKGKNYILQKHISSRTTQGDPFDCRIHVEKNGQGKWESARNYIRIGIGQTVISNVNQGGGISDVDSFLKANFGEKWKRINENLNELAQTLPYKVEELRKTHIMSLGLDVGIDRNGELYLFEVNDGPATFAVKSEVAFLRASYYKYIFKKLDNGVLIELEKEREKFKELEIKYTEVVNSDSQGPMQLLRQKLRSIKRFKKFK